MLSKCGVKRTQWRGVRAMSEWFYVWLSYGVTWIAFLVYWFRLRARRIAALRILTDGGSNDGAN